jgi:hypothetical protein
VSKSADPGGNKGASMGGLEKSPTRRKREAAKRRHEEKQWAAKSGPVVSYIDPSRIRPQSQNNDVT